VLELAEIWAGPYCGALLGDLGAEVIKVESIQRIGRGQVRPRQGSPGYPNNEPGERPWNRSANFNALSRNKLGITLDLTTPRGVETFGELVATSDAVFCNYAFGVMDSFGLGYDAMRAMRPDLIVMQMPGFGNTGPYKRYRSMGMSIDAISGHSALRGYPDLDLTHLSLVHHPDAVGGVTAAFAICAALHYRARTGKGQFIDMSQSEAFMPHLGELVLEFGMTGRVRERRGNDHPEMAPHGCYPCLGDDKWVTIAVRSDEEWRELCQAIAMPELAEDARFSTLEYRLENRSSLNEIVGRWTSERDRYEVTDLLQERGIPAGPVIDCGPDTYDDPHLQERGYFQEVAHPDAGTYLLSGPIWKLAGTPEPVHGPAPCLGEHNGYVLGQVLGIPEAELDGLEAEQVIGTVPLEGSDMGGVRRVRRQAQSGP
jgi:crotonobetainyl-CoA:carnitine CoA-transferase CaiB-like acyl-CoA transferase